MLSIVVELPRTALGGGIIRLWETTNVSNGFNFVQQDRLARPAINEALATASQSRHDVNNKDNPTDDSTQLVTDIEAFLTFPAGRSVAIKQTIESVLVPDVLVADLSNMTDKASYLGIETGGYTGGKFGGRSLIDDTIDIDLSTVFGNVIPTLFPKIDTTNDHQVPQLTTDNVRPSHRHPQRLPVPGCPPLIESPFGIDFQVRTNPRRPSGGGFLHP